MSKVRAANAKVGGQTRLEVTAAGSSMEKLVRVRAGARRSPSPADRVQPPVGLLRVLVPSEWEGEVLPPAAEDLSPGPSHDLRPQ